MPFHLLDQGALFLPIQSTYNLCMELPQFRLLNDPINRAIESNGEIGLKGWEIHIIKHSR